MGAEESFGQAAKRFQEHYGWAIDRAAVRREVEKTALKAEQYVETRLWEAGWNYIQPLTTRPGIEQVLVELDGISCPANNLQLHSNFSPPMKTS